jgi:hypothetical protein
MSRELLKLKFLTQGLILDDDDCLYKNGKMIARNVKIIEDAGDFFAFQLDMINDSVDIGIKLTPSPKTRGELIKAREFGKVTDRDLGKRIYGSTTKKPNLKLVH